MKFSEMPYKRIKMEEVEKEYKSIIERTKNAKSGEEQFEIHREYYRFTADIQTSMELAMIRHDIDTTDEFYEKESDFYDEVGPIISQYENEYGKVLYDSPYRDYLESKIGKVTFKNIEIANKAFDEKIIPLMQEENALSSRYSKLIATAKIPFEGEVYNLSLMRKFQTSPDREVRRKAWKAVSEYFQSVTDEIDEIYDKMVKNRTEQARKLGYENYVELGYYRMNRNCYDKRWWKISENRSKSILCLLPISFTNSAERALVWINFPILIQTCISPMEIRLQREHRGKFLQQDRRCMANCLHRQKNFLIL